MILFEPWSQVSWVSRGLRSSFGRINKVVIFGGRIYMILGTGVAYCDDVWLVNQAQR